MPSKKKKGNEDIYTALTEISEEIQADNREASKSFAEMQQTVRALVQDNPATTKDPIEYLRKFNKAKAAAAEYRKTHSGTHFSSRGSERLAWAESLKTTFESMEKDDRLKKISTDLRKANLTEAKEVMRNGLKAIRDPNPDNRPADPEQMFRRTYGRILFERMMERSGNICDPDKESKQFEKFITSKSFEAIFTKKDSVSLKEMLDNYSAETIDKELKLVKDHAFLDKVPAPVADKWIEATKPSYSEKRRFFDHVVKPDDDITFRIVEAKGKPAKAGFSPDRTALCSMTIGKLIADGHSFKDIFDPFKLDYERHKAGQEVLDKFLNADEQEFAEFGVRNLKAGLKGALDFVNDKLSHAGTLTLENLTSAEGQTLREVNRLLIDFGQEIVRPFKKDEKEVPQDIKKLIDDQFHINSSLGYMLDEAEVGCRNMAAFYPGNGKKIPERAVNGYGVGRLLFCDYAKNALNKLIAENPEQKFTDKIQEGPDGSNPFLTKMSIVLNELSKIKAEDFIKDPTNYVLLAKAVLNDRVPSTVKIDYNMDKMKLKTSGVRDFTNQCTKEAKKLNAAVAQKTKTAKSAQPAVQKKSAELQKDNGPIIK